MDWETLLSLLGPSAAMANESGVVPGALPGPLNGLPIEPQVSPVPTGPRPLTGIGSDVVASIAKPPIPPSPVSLGAALDPTGGMTAADYQTPGPNIPQTQAPPSPAPSGIPGGPVAGPYSGSPENNPNLKPIGPSGAPASRPIDLASVLRGVTVPKPPTPQTVHTPAAPRPVAAIHSGELINLLQMLNTAGRANQSGLNLPPTLGAALGQHQYPV